MKTKNKIKTAISLGVFILSISLGLTGCSQDSPLQPDQRRNNSFIKYTHRAKKTIQYDIFNQVYGEGEMILANKSRFKFRKGSLTPPARCKKGDDVTITVDVSFDEENSVMTYTFGPSGCRFQPCLEAEFDYSALETDHVKLYFIEDNETWTELIPTRIDTEKKILYYNIPHFSRYALAHAE